MHASVLLLAALPILAAAAPQEAGSPQYNCHATCGKAITLSKAGSAPAICETEFKDIFTDCLACSGPDGANIWRYYGSSLKPVGTSCGFPTEPGAAAPEPVESTPVEETPAEETSTTETPAEETTSTDNSVSTEISSTPVSTSIVTVTTVCTTATGGAALNTSVPIAPNSVCLVLLSSIAVS